jgi:Family of unknown function (DUF6252)
MQKLLSALLLFGTVLFFASCQEEIVDPNNTNTGAVTGNFKAKINGTQWVANSIAGASRFSGLINLTGRSSDGKLITITLTDSGVHNYTLDDMSFNVAAYTDSTLADPSAFTTNQGVNPGEAGGTVSITSIDTANKRMSGVFSFKVFRQADSLQRTMTEGSFTNISYATSLPPSNATDTFRVKIAGTMWVPPTIAGVKTPAIPPMPAQIMITGTTATATKSVGLFMPADITPGSYTLDFWGLQYIGQYNPDTDPNNSQASMSGTLTIISHNTTTKRIRGTFNFHAEALLNPLISTELTEGYFSITYQ